MSLLIKEMKMPEKCPDCNFESELGFCLAKSPDFCGYTDDIRRPDWCPLVELPEHHVDLVDVNEIRWDDHYDSDGNLTEYKVAYSDEMPDPIIRGE